jgi:tryptophan halogenase
MSDQEATEKLLREVEGKTIIQPRVIKFRTGRRLKAWNKNVVALGLASGFVEPLESTSIQLIMTGVNRLIYMFPFFGVTPSFVDQYNEDVRHEQERVRDFIILHYHVSERDDTQFWRECTSMSVPDTLSRRIQMFRERAHAWQGAGELFRVDSWTHVMLGQRLQPAHYHQLTTALPDRDLTRLLEGIRTAVNGTVERMPIHQDFLAQYCPASAEIWQRPGPTGAP